MGSLSPDKFRIILNKW